MFGAFGGLLLLAKIILHLRLLSKTDDEFDLSSMVFSFNLTRQNQFAKRLLLPSFEKVQRNYQTLKTTINILYVAAMSCLIIFIIAITFFRPKN
jgi:hypothetical protein